MKRKKEHTQAAGGNKCKVKLKGTMHAPSEANIVGKGGRWVNGGKIVLTASGGTPHSRLRPVAS